MSAHKGKPRSAPSPGQEGTHHQPPWAALAEKSGSLQRAARPLRTLPSLRSHLPAWRCNLPALSRSLLAPSPPPLSCQLTFTTASPQLPGTHQLDQVGCQLAPSRRGWERVGPPPLPGSSPWTLQPHCNAAYSSHLPVVIPSLCTGQSTPSLAGGKRIRREEPSRNNSTATIPSGTHSISQAKGTPALSQAFVKRLHPKRNAGWRTGRVRPAGNLHPQPPASLGSRVSVLARTPRLGGVRAPVHRHRPALPLCRHPSTTRARGMLSPPLQFPHPLKPQPGPDSQPLERSKAENHHRLLPRQEDWTGRQRWEVSWCTHMHAHTQNHAHMQQCAQPHTHPLSLHH